MNSEISILPDNVDSLKGIIISQAEQYKDQIRFLEEQIRFFKARLYGRKSEKLTEEELKQLFLFNEAEEIIEKPSSEEQAEELIVEGHTRKKVGRRPLPEAFPRVEVIHDLSNEEKLCDCGCNMSRIGEEVSEKLDIIPARIQVIKHIRYKYACKGCEGVESSEGAVRTGILPPQLIPQGIATPGLVSYILISKFADALPFYRQEKVFERIGVELGRATMSNWAIHVSRQCETLIEMMWKEIRSGPLINMDETPVQVLKEPGRANTSKSWMWIFRGGNPDRPTLIFQYDPSRSGDVPKRNLGKYKGYIQTDGYQGYNIIGETEGIVHLGCFAHVRRKFMEAVKAGKKGASKKKAGYAEQALSLIGELYGIEKYADKKEFCTEKRYELRQNKTLPILEKFRKLLDDAVLRTPPQGLLGKAVGYALNQWNRLERYTENGLLRPDNNLAENAIRPFVIGRKNWLFSGSPRGAEASATIYSLIETAKANGLEPYRYLRYLFENLPSAQTVEDYKALLPMSMDRNLINNLEL